MRSSDWSSDVCSSDLPIEIGAHRTRRLVAQLDEDAPPVVIVRPAAEQPFVGPALDPPARGGGGAGRRDANAGDRHPLVLQPPPPQAEQPAPGRIAEPFGPAGLVAGPPRPDPPPPTPPAAPPPHTRPR